MSVMGKTLILGIKEHSAGVLVKLAFHLMVQNLAISLDTLTLSRASK